MSVSGPAFQSERGRENWLPTLQLAVREVFELMLACSLEVPTAAPAEEELDITAMIGLAGPLRGVLTVRCRNEAATRMAGRMLGIDVNPAGPETWDAVGEICNMIAGGFKNKISTLGDSCLLSLPTVITGADCQLQSHANVQVLRTALLFEGETVLVSLEIHG
jgi:chemotaxis protein CheX